MSILAAVDGETVPDESVAVGAELARQFDEDLVVLHVMPRDLFDDHQKRTPDSEADIVQSLAPGIRYGGGVNGAEAGYTIEDGQRDAASVAQNVAEETLDESDDVTFQGRVGNPVEELLAEADRRDPRYLVIGGRKRTPVGKAIFGSTTQAVLLNADRPVMAVMRE